MLQSNLVRSSGALPGHWNRYVSPAVLAAAHPGRILDCGRTSHADLRGGIRLAGLFPLWRRLHLGLDRSTVFYFHSSTAGLMYHPEFTGPLPCFSPDFRQPRHLLQSPQHPEPRRMDRRAKNTPVPTSARRAKSRPLTEKSSPAGRKARRRSRPPRTASPLRRLSAAGSPAPGEWWSLPRHKGYRAG